MQSGFKYDISLGGFVQQVTETLNLPVAYETIKVKYTHHGEYRYFADFVVSFGERLAKDGFGVYVNRMWADDELIYDRAAAFAKPATPIPADAPPRLRELSRMVVNPPANEPPPPIPEQTAPFTFFDGNEEQGPVYRDMHYRGLMVARFINFDLTDYGNRIPAITAELVDSNPEIDTQTTLGAINSQRVLPTLTNEFHSDTDALYRGYYKWTGEAFTFHVGKVRPSIKAETTIIDLGNATDNSPEQLRDTLTAIVPALNVLVVQPGVEPEFKVLHNLQTGAGITGIVTPAWQAMVPFPVGGDWFAVGAAEVSEDDQYSIGVLSIKGQSLAVSWMDAITEPVRCLTIGKANTGSVDIYVTTDSEVIKLVFTPATGAVATSIYSAEPSNTLRQCWYDPEGDRLHVLAVSGGLARLVVLNAAHAVIRTSDTFAPPPVGTARSASEEARSSLAGGKLVVASNVTTGTGDHLTYIDLVTGEALPVEVDDFAPDGEEPLYTTTIWDGATNTVYGTLRTFITFGAIPEVGDDADRYTAGEVMREFAKHVGYGDGDVITENMDDMFIDGYVISTPTTLASVSTMLGTLYGFSWVERVGDIIYKSAYDDGDLIVDKVQPPNRLAYLSSSEDSTQYINVVRRSDQGLPATLSMAYFDMENDYKPGFQRAFRSLAPVETQESKQSEQWSLPLSIDGDYAVELLYDALYRMWATKVTYSLRLPAEGILLDAGDILEFSANGYAYHAQISRHIINGDYSVSLDLVEAATATYPVAVEAQPSVAISKGIAPVRAIILDIPDQSPAQDDGELHLSVLLTGYVPGKFDGAVFEAYIDGSWTTLKTISAEQGAYVGSLSAELPTWSEPFELDTDNSIYLDVGTINPALLEALPLLAIGEGSDVELVEFADYEHIGGDIYRLYNLSRGRYGTEFFMRNRLIGTTVSLLINKINLNYSYLDFENGYSLRYRAYAPKQPVWQVDAFDFVPEGNSRKPYEPINVRVTQDDTTALIFEWTRRVRFVNSPPNDLDNPGPLDEPSELYELHVTLDPFLPPVVFRTDQPSFTLTPPGGEPLPEFSSIMVAIYQVSDVTVGRGIGGGKVYPVYPADAVFMSVAFDLGGEMVIEEPDGGIEFTLGGSMTANVHVASEHSLVATFDLGGTMETNLDNYKMVYIKPKFDLGGELIVVPETPEPPYYGVINPGWQDANTWLLLYGDTTDDTIKEYNNQGSITLINSPVVGRDGLIVMNENLPAQEDRFNFTPPNMDMLTPQTNWTAEFFIRVPEGVTGNLYKGIFGRFDGNNGRSWAIRDMPHNVAFWRGGGAGATAAFDLADGQIHHVAVVKQGNNYRFYKDGELVGTDFFSDGPFTTQAGGLRVGGGFLAFLEAFRTDIDVIRLSPIARYDGPTAAIQPRHIFSGDLPGGGDNDTPTGPAHAPVIVGSVTQETDGYDVTINLPSGTQVGDYMVLVPHRRVGQPYAGWNPLTDVGGMFGRFVTSGDVSAGSLTLNGLMSLDPAIVSLTVIRNVDPIEPVVAGLIGEPTSVEGRTPGVTSQGDNRLLLGVRLDWLYYSSGFTNYTSEDLTELSKEIVRANKRPNLNSDAGLYVGYEYVGPGVQSGQIYRNGVSTDRGAIDLNTSYVGTLLLKGMEATEAVTLVGSTATTYQTAATLIGATIPVETSEGDLIVAAVFNSGTVTPPAGFTLVRREGPIGSSGRHLDVYTKLASNTDAGELVNFTQSVSSRFGIQLSVFKHGEGLPLTVLDDVALATNGGIPAAIAETGIDAFNVAYTVSISNLLTTPSTEPREVTVSAPWVQLGSVDVPDNRLGVAYYTATEAGNTGGNMTFEVTSGDNEMLNITLHIGAAP